MFVALYRWKIHPDREDEFIAAWSRVSDLLLRERGSLGSRLHRGSDGLWYSYAQWPSAQARKDAFAQGPVDADASERMNAAIQERFPEVTLDMCADFLQAIPPTNIMSTSSRPQRTRSASNSASTPKTASAAAPTRSSPRKKPNGAAQQQNSRSKQQSQRAKSSSRMEVDDGEDEESDGDDDGDNEEEEESKEAPRDSAAASSSSTPARFAGKSLYEVLGVARDATADVIKKAYRRMALSCHPDLNKSPTATEEFQYLSRCHEILSDPAKRKQYDLTGSLDEADAESEDVDAYEYWRTVFPKISIADIESYQKKYEGGEEEKEDVLAAYDQHDGDMEAVFQSVPFASSSSLDRILSILAAARGLKLTRTERKQLLDSLKEQEVDESAEAEEEMKKHLSKSEQALLKSGGSDSTKGLAMILAQRQRDRTGTAFLSQMEAKYAEMERKEREQEKKKKGQNGSSSSGKRKGTDDDEDGAVEDEDEAEGTSEPTEEEFAAIQARMNARAKSNGNAKRKASPKKKTKR